MQCLSNSMGLESIVKVYFKIEALESSTPYYTEAWLLAPLWKTRVLEERVREE